MTQPRIPSHVTAGALALALAPAFWPSDAMAQEACTDEAADLIAAQTITVGDVNVCNDGTALTVTYEATGPWCLLETNLHVATIAEPPLEPDDNIPQTQKGNPMPDEFAFGDVHDCVGMATFEIPLADIDGGVLPGDTVVIAAHAVVEDDAGRVEGAWGDGTRFVEEGRNWAMYFTYEVQEPSCDQPGGFCTVFVTSTTHNGNLGGLVGADAICQGLAEAVGSQAAPGTYLAWLSDATAWPTSRFSKASVPYKLVDGTTIADDWDDLVDDSLDQPINRTEGRELRDISVWTGTASSGIPGTEASEDRCADWTVGEASFVGFAGRSDRVDGGWTEAFSGGDALCDQPFALYCFQQ